jgi:hypothetical protein
MASNVKILAATVLAVSCSVLSFTARAEEKADAASDNGAAKTGAKDEKATVVAIKPSDAPAPAPMVKGEPIANPPANARLIILDGQPVYVDEKMNILGPVKASAPSKDGSAAAAAPAADPKADARRKEIEEAAAKIELDNNIHAAIRRLGTAGFREAKTQLIGYGKVAIPYLIDAMTNTEADGSPAPNHYQLNGHIKADTGHATNNRTRAEVCSELLTEIITNHTNYKGDLPTLDQQEWQTWWVANGDKITFAN